MRKGGTNLPPASQRPPRTHTGVTREEWEREQERAAREAEALSSRDFSQPIGLNEDAVGGGVDAGEVIGRAQLVEDSERNIARDGLPEGYRDPRDGRTAEGRAAERAEENAPPVLTPPSLEVPDDLLTRLERELGLSSNTVYKQRLSIKDLVLDFEFRRPSYDDYLWASGVWDRRLSGEEEELYTPAQISQLIDHLTACRCVLRVNGSQPVEMFKMVPALNQYLEALNREKWDGEPDSIPAAFANDATIKFFDKMRTLHPAILAFISSEVEAIEKREREVKPVTGVAKANP